MQPNLLPPQRGDRPDILNGLSTMKEVLETFPGAQRALFRRYHIGGCSSCGFQPEETLSALCVRNNRLDVQEVVEHIRQSHEEDQKIQISPADLAALLSAENPPRLLDIRTREEWDTVKIESAVFFTQDLMQEMLSRWPRDLPLVIYDHQGKHSMDAAAYFLGHGFTKVRSLRGGIDAWAQGVRPDLLRYQLQDG